MKNNRWLLLTGLFLSSFGSLFCQPEGPGYEFLGRTGSSPFSTTPITVNVGIPFSVKAESTPTAGVLALTGMDSVSPRFEAFWMFGDGNFIKSSTGTTLLDLASLQTDYRFAQAGTYAAAAVMTKKYTDRRPPEYAAHATVTVTPATLSGPTAVFQTKLIPNKLVHVFANHPARIDYPMVCPISFIRNADFIDQSVILLYNRKKSEPAGRTVNSPFHYQKTLPNYFLTGSAMPVEYELTGPAWPRTAGAVEPAPVYATPFKSVAEARFGNCLIWRQGKLERPLDSGTTGAASFPIPVHESIREWRLFPEFKMDLLPDEVGKTFEFVAIILGRSPNPGINDKLLESHLPGVDSKVPVLGADTNTPLYIQDIHVLATTALSSHDPSFLKVDSLCKKGPNLYEVGFSLTLCNTGQLSDTQAFIVLDEPGTPLSDIHFDNFEPVNSPSVAEWQKPAAENRWKFVVNVELPVVMLLPTGEFSPGCKSVHFKMTTDDVGAARLYEMEPVALQPLVKFSLGGDFIEHSQYQPIPSGRFKKGNDIKPCTETGCNCPIKICCDCPWICWLGLFILLILLLLWWFLIKRQPA